MSRIIFRELSTAPSTPASGQTTLFVDTNGDLATRKDAGGIKIATSPASGDYTLTVDGTGTAARLNASNVFTSAQVLPAGTNSAPALTTTGDTNTGIYFPAADNIGFSTGGTIRGRWTTDGLCFNADTAAANALDDYEEGTWTPVLGGSGGTSGQTYSLQVGRYTKIGRLVVCGFEATLTAVGTVTSFAVISGLPFASASTGSNLDGGGLLVTFTSAMAQNQIYVTGYVTNNETRAWVTGIDAAGTGIGNLTATNIWGSSTRVSGVITYTA